MDKLNTDLTFKLVRNIRLKYMVICRTLIIYKLHLLYHNRLPVWKDHDELL